MAIRPNRYNDPALGAAFENIASIFAPPSAQDLVGYTTAQAKKQEAERLAWLFANPNDPLADRKATMAGVYTPTQSYYAVDQNNAVTMRGQDVTADTARATNLTDNQFGLAKQFMTPLNPGQVTPGLPGGIAAQFGVPELPRTEGLPKPLSLEEQKAKERADLRSNGMLSDTILLDTILGADAPVKTVDTNGKPIYSTPGAAARTGAQAYVDAGSQPANIQEYEFARANGYTGTFDQWVTSKAKAGASSVQVGADGKLGAVPQGYMVVQDPAAPNGVRMVPVPGGPADKQAQRVGNAGIASDVVNTAASRALEADKERLLGNVFGYLASYVPGTSNAEVYKQVDVLKSNATIEALNAMRAASPTGGALGSVTDRENAMLAAKAGMLDPASPNFQRDLRDYQRTLLRTIHGTAEGDRIFAEQMAAPAAVGGATVAAPPAAPAATTAPTPVQSVEEAMKLPSGTLVVSPDGRTFEVP